MAHERILLADDDVAHRRQCRAALERAEYTVLEAADGTQLVTLAQAHRPQLILADLLMPGMDGFEPVIALQGQPATAAIPILYFSTLSPEETRAQGVAHFMTKPFERRDLIEAVRRVLRPRPSSKMPPTVLVVDDERDIVEIVCDYLGDAGYRGVGAHDGQEALAVIERERPGAIVLDVKMPVLDGYGVIRWVKRHPTFRTIPIIILTATRVLRVTDSTPDNPHHLVMLPKPCEPARLIAAVKEALHAT